MSDTAPSTRTAPLALWRVAGAFLRTLYALFGGPEDVAARHTLQADAHAQLASWLRLAEAMLRRLLLIEAAAYPKPNTRPLRPPARPRVRKPMGFDADAPEKWRVSFRCFVESKRRPRQPAPVKERAPRKRVSREDRWCFTNFKPVRFRSAWPLAERYEALIRVFNDPVSYARRLARRLHATPDRVAAVLRAPPEAVHRLDRFEETGRRGERAARVFFSSG